MHAVCMDILLGASGRENPFFVFAKAACKNLS
jgi:hypothetical protein